MSRPRLRAPNFYAPAAAFMSRPFLLGAMAAIALCGVRVWGGRIHAQGTKQTVQVRSFVVHGYPAVARAANVQGDVSVVVHLGSDGSIESVSDIKGPQLLSFHAVKDVELWQFSVSDNKPAQLPVLFRFSLAGQPAAYPTTQFAGALPDLVTITTNPGPSANASAPIPVQPKKN